MLKEYTGPKFGPAHDGWHILTHKDGSVKEVKANGAFTAAQKVGWTLSDITDVRFIKCPACDLRLDNEHSVPRPVVQKPMKLKHTYKKGECCEASE